MGERVAIAGGGLAGLTCAKYLVDAGFEVEVIESAPYLGGRAATFRDQDGHWIEQGLHLYLGVYSEFDRLLCEIGQPPDRILDWMTEVRLQDPQGPQAVYGINPLRAPLKTLLRLLGQNDYLDPTDKIALLPMLGPGVLDVGTLERLFDGMTVTEWWGRLGGRTEVLERFLRPFCRAIQFTDADEFSAYNMLAWIHHVTYGLPRNLLAGYKGARDETIFQPLAKYLRDRGAKVRTGVRLDALGYAPGEPGTCGRLTGFELADGTRLEADAYVVALPSWVLRGLVPEPLQAMPYFQNIATLPIAPAISVQIWFDTDVVGTSDFTLVTRGLAPVYQDVARTAYPEGDGSRVSVVLSPADDLLDRTDQELVHLAIKTLSEVEPRIGRSLVLKSKVLRHPEHLIRPLPGAMSRRPSQATPVPNMFLAGDWTHQDFFGSQEGAVRSGRLAANEVLRALSTELRISWLPEDLGRHARTHHLRP